ncbi:MAG TPA: hypothetical protein VHO69_03405 [Phototrophicaceae bacterium]|nr:hypothetical protein [Phototrophicaceae bacterium]
MGQQIYHAERFTFPGWFDGQKSACDVQVFDTDQRRVVIISELITPEGGYACHGLSVTNGIEQIATLVMQHLPLHPMKTTFIEHYPERGPNVRKPPGSFKDPIFAESFAIVSFNWQPHPSGTPVASQPDWWWVSRADVEALIEQKFFVPYVDDLGGEDEGGVYV